MISILLGSTFVSNIIVNQTMWANSLPTVCINCNHVKKCTLERLDVLKTCRFLTDEQKMCLILVDTLSQLTRFYTSLNFWKRVYAMTSAFSWQNSIR